jgi:hypothetical protein
MIDESVGAPGGPDSDRAGAAGRAPDEDEGSRKGSPHTSPKEGHPAGPGERSDRDVGGPTSPEVPADEDATGSGPSTTPESEFESHE